MRQCVATRQCGGIQSSLDSFQLALPARLSVWWVKPLRRFFDIRLGPALSALSVPEIHEAQKKNHQDTIKSVPFMFLMAESSCKKKTLPIGLEALSSHLCKNRSCDSRLITQQLQRC